MNMALAKGLLVVSVAINPKKVLSNLTTFPIFMAIAPVTVSGRCIYCLGNAGKQTLTNNIGGTR
jgi:hypothetical protein